MTHTKKRCQWGANPGSIYVYTRKKVQTLHAQFRPRPLTCFTLPKRLSHGVLWADPWLSPVGEAKHIGDMAWMEPGWSHFTCLTPGLSLVCSSWAFSTIFSQFLLNMLKLKLWVALLTPPGSNIRRSKVENCWPNVLSEIVNLAVLWQQRIRYPAGKYPHSHCLTKGWIKKCNCVWLALHSRWKIASGLHTSFRIVNLNSYTQNLMFSLKWCLLLSKQLNAHYSYRHTPRPFQFWCSFNCILFGLRLCFCLFLSNRFLLWKKELNVWVGFRWKIRSMLPNLQA